VLRLVNAEPSSASPARHAPASSERLVRAANRDASQLDALDARWVLAVRTTMSLQGGRAAILRPDDRRSLVTQAARMGLRPFDAALVIAIAQDAARSGEALSGSPQDRLAMVRPPSSTESISPGMLLFFAFGIGAVLFVLLKWWLMP
jgi:hypothetical protein